MLRARGHAGALARNREVAFEFNVAAASTISSYTILSYIVPDRTVSSNCGGTG
jgi:hypothetical protein